MFQALHRVPCRPKNNAPNRTLTEIGENSAGLSPNASWFPHVLKNGRSPRRPASEQPAVTVMYDSAARKQVREPQGFVRGAIR
jgi:hypothetical protein